MQKRTAAARPAELLLPSPLLASELVQPPQICPPSRGGLIRPSRRANLPLQMPSGMWRFRDYFQKLCEAAGAPSLLTLQLLGRG